MGFRNNWSVGCVCKAVIMAVVVVVEIGMVH